MASRKLSTHDFIFMKQQKQKIVMVTAYDFPGGQAAAEAGSDVILVGDSLGMVVLGYESTLQVTMDEMVHHSRAARRGAPYTFLVTDMPFLSCHVSLPDAVKNAGRIIQEGMADAVKIEGGSFSFAAIEAVCKAQIPVVGHLGLTPQSVYRFGGYKVQGKDVRSAAQIVEDALRLQELGVFMLVLECVPADLGALLSQKLEIPIIGIGAGAGCDGQVLVYHDLLGIHAGSLPKFARKFKDLHSEAVSGIRDYADEVRMGSFPAESEQYGGSPLLLDQVMETISAGQNAGKKESE